MKSCVLPCFNPNFASMLYFPEITVERQKYQTIQLLYDQRCDTRKIPHFSNRLPGPAPKGPSLCFQITDKLQCPGDFRRRIPVASHIQIQLPPSSI